MAECRTALVVDDNPANRMLAARMLQKMGWDAAEAEDGDTALHHLDAATVDVVLLDISMPGMSGEVVCQTLRARGNTAKVIAYTAHAQPAELERFRACGFDGLLVKPITRQTLQQALDEVGLRPS